MTIESDEPMKTFYEFPTKNFPSLQDEKQLDFV